MQLHQRHPDPHTSVPSSGYPKTSRHRFFSLLVFLLLAASGVVAQTRTLDVRLSVGSLNPARLRVEGVAQSETKNWSFRDTYASVSGLGNRIEKLSLMDTAGARVAFRKLAAGEYESERAATGFSYEVDLTPPPLATDAAHVSWLTGECGVLMLGDLLPLPVKDVAVQFTLPANWSVASTETRTADSRFQITDAENAVFLVGGDLRTHRGRAASVAYSFVAAGNWAFSDDEAAKAVESILEQHAKIIGGAPAGQVSVVIAPFPVNASAQMWSAETRGRTVLLLMGRYPSKTAALSQLSVPLTHELLHLWVPNALMLEGEYDWFYEGFTLYQALRVGVRLGYFSFQDYLRAVARAFEGYEASKGTGEVSLVEASRRRWSGSAGLIYNKGMLVAFLYDLNLRLQTSGKRSLDDAYRELFSLYGRTKTRVDANDALLKLLSRPNGMEAFTRRYIEEPAQLEPALLTKPFGLRYEPVGARARFVVAEPLSRTQRDLLRGLGYNEKLEAPRARKR